MSKKPVMLMILDGYGINENTEGNAIYAANTPNMDRLMANCPHTIISSSGLDVGLPDGQMGNSEVGHTNIGAGRVVYQDLTRISKSIKDGDFFENPEFLSVIDNCKKNNSALHFMGLLSDGGVHSHNTHLYGLLELAKKNGLNKVYIHAFLDGRDVPPNSAIDYVKELDEKIKEIGVGQISSIMGRYYAMDRDSRWDRVEKAYDVMVNRVGEEFATGEEAVSTSYSNDVFDEFVLPCKVKGGEGIQDNDGVIFFNFRPDRAREITRAFIDPEFNGFERKLLSIKFVCLTQYDSTIPNVSVAYGPDDLVNTFGEYISEKGLKQLRIAETEKYAHVTFFFNGGVEQEYLNEDRALIPSPKVATYDLKPEMSAYEVKDEAIKRINSGKYDVIILNFANPDMVGHTGIMEAAIKAVEAVDICVGEVVDAVEKQGGVVLITADHGNSEKMIDYDTNGAFTAHTTFRVPLVAVGIGDVKLEEGKLSDLTPTMLDILGLEIPSEMTGHSLISK